jgi:hypothetical protein
VQIVEVEARAAFDFAEERGGRDERGVYKKQKQNKGKCKSKSKCSAKANAGPSTRCARSG